MYACCLCRGPHAFSCIVQRTKKYCIRSGTDSLTELAKFSDRFRKILWQIQKKFAHPNYLARVRKWHTSHLKEKCLRASKSKWSDVWCGSRRCQHQSKNIEDELTLVGWGVVCGQTGQHSPKGISGLGQSSSWSSHVMSSQRTNPESHTHIWHGSGFQTSLSA